MKRKYYRWLQWITIPLSIFCSLEIASRYYFNGKNLGWYDSINPKQQPNAERAIFIGTSRVAASIDEAIFKEIFPNSDCHNMGMGHSTIALHYIAIRNLLEANPDFLASSAVFIEAPMSLPPFYHEEELSWNGRIFVDIPWGMQLLQSVANSSDIPLILRSGYDIENKLAYSARVLSKRSLLIHKREIINVRIPQIFKAKLEEHMVSKNNMINKENSLTANGGIRTDSEGIEAIRRQQELLASKNYSAQEDIPDLQESPLNDLIDLLESRQAKVIFFTPPLHTSSRHPLNTPKRRIESRKFQSYLRERGIPLLQPKFEYTDKDFPDKLHLARHKSPEFTRALIQEWNAF